MAWSTGERAGGRGRLRCGASPIIYMGKQAVLYKEFAPSHTLYHAW